MTSNNPDMINIYRSTSVSLTPSEYFTDSTGTINIKSDVTLVVGDEKFFCHRLLLSLASPVFARMFDGSFQEHSAREIVLHEKKAATILELLKHIYPQFNGSVTNENIEEFLLLSDEYMIENLKRPCQTLLLEQLNAFDHVSLPGEYRAKQQSLKSKSFHASDSALETSLHQEEDRSAQRSSPFGLRVRRPDSASRSSHLKLHSSNAKSTDKSANSSSNSYRYVLFLNQNQMPTFYDKSKKSIDFGAAELELWIRRLRILYQIDRARQYGNVIDKIIAILQFVPGSMLAGLAHVRMETFSTDELFINDIARARMFMLEEWSADGESSRLVRLPDAFTAMSPTTLASAAEKLEISQSENTESSTPSVFVSSTTDLELFQGIQNDNNN